MILDENAPKSPLRFPGSKSKVMKKLMPYLDVPHKEYREPFFGGGSIFLTKELAMENWLNDKNQHIATLWKIIRDKPEDLIYLIENNYPSLELWHEIKGCNYKKSVKKAFKYLFLNRTNFSGIINANPIGGLSQESKYKIDCRWNSNYLIKRIKACSKKLVNAKITSLDFEELILKDGEDVLLMLDPPYYKKGKQLYSVYMKHEEHKKLADLLKETEHKFFLTIDNCDEVKELYNWANFAFTERWYYTIHSKNKKKGKELFITNFEVDINKNKNIMNG